MKEKKRLYRFTVIEDGGDFDNPNPQVLLEFETRLTLMEAETLYALIDGGNMDWLETKKEELAE